MQKSSKRVLEMDSILAPHEVPHEVPVGMALSLRRGKVLYKYFDASGSKTPFGLTPQRHYVIRIL